MRDSDMNDNDPGPSEADLDMEAEFEQASLESNPFSPEYLSSIHAEEFGEVEKFSELTEGATLLTRLGAVVEGLSHDANMYLSFVRMFETTDIKPLSVTVTFGETDQQLIQQGLLVLSLLQDDERISNRAYALQVEINDALSMESVHLPQEDFDRRREWQATEHGEQLAKALGFESVQAMKDAVISAAFENAEEDEGE